MSPAQEIKVHTAIIMDGNGRWASRRGLPRSFGHRAGVKTARRVIEAAPDSGIGTLTLYAFSSDNWLRPAREVETLMDLMHGFLADETERCARQGLRLSVIGRRDRIRLPLVRAIERAERRTVDGDRLHLRLAIDYSGRDAILAAASTQVSDVPLDRPRFQRRLHEVIHSSPEVPELDLLIRTGGEKRLSDFLLWESAYAELHFSDRLWPDFRPMDLRDAIADFRARDRRFGALPERAPTSSPATAA